MSQTLNSTDFLVRDAHGKPQVIKVVQTGHKLSGVVPQGVIKTLSGTPMRRIILDQDNFTDSSGSSSDAIKQRIQQAGIKIVRSSDMTQKTIKLTPSQMQNLQHPRMSAGQSLLTTKLASSSPAKMVVRQVAAAPVVKRASVDSDVLALTDYNKRRRADKLGKGLRHFSLKVCEKVRLKGTTTYNEVADELVAEFTGAPFKPNQDQNYDQKNIRRRVYDALNVLMAMNIISKEKKEIRWIGYPTTMMQSTKNLERDRLLRAQRVREKAKELDNLILQQIAVKNLIERNKQNEAKVGAPKERCYVGLPFLVVNTNRDTMVNCSVSEDRKSYSFDFDDKFEIHDEFHILKGMGMTMGLDKGEWTPETISKAVSLVPKSLEQYVLQMATQPDLPDAEGDDTSMEATPAGPSAWHYAESKIYCEDSDTASDTEADVH